MTLLWFNNKHLKNHIHKRLHVYFRPSENEASVCHVACLGSENKASVCHVACLGIKPVFVMLPVLAVRMKP